jgi:hypothetical protein
MVTCLPRESGVKWLHGYMVTWLNGFMATCLPRESGVKWLYGYMPAPGHRGLNDKYHSPRIYSWVEFGARDTPNLILHAISIRFVIKTVPSTVQISDFRFQNSEFRSTVFQCLPRDLGGLPRDLGGLPRDPGGLPRDIGS